MDYTIYSDFTSAECYGLNEQLISLGERGAVRWRGVQHEPGLPAPMKTLDRRAIGRLEDAIDDVKRLVSGIVIGRPFGKPNSSRAIVAAAAVARHCPAKGDAFRDAVYRAYWRESTDLSVLAELQRVADLVGVPRSVELDDPEAAETVENWELDWATERLGGVPRVIRGDGRILWGLRPREEVADFFRIGT